MFAGWLLVKLGMSGDPGGDESGLGIGGYCVLLALNEVCSADAGDPCPCVACTLPCSSGAFPDVRRLGGAGNGYAACTTISETLCDTIQQRWRTTGELDGGGGDVRVPSIGLLTTGFLLLCLTWILGPLGCTLSKEALSCPASE
jgi:hypothetical protein